MLSGQHKITDWANRVAIATLRDVVRQRLAFFGGKNPAWEYNGKSAQKRKFEPGDTKSVPGFWFENDMVDKIDGKKFIMEQKTTQSSPQYLAHGRSPKYPNGQSVEEHSKNTAEICKSFAVDDLKEICYAAGLLHDIGKYQNSFQRRINGENVSVEHSICGAKAAIERYGDNALGILLALCAAGHHSGIPDCGVRSETEDNPSLFGRLKRKSEAFDQYQNELQVPALSQKQFNDLILKYCRSADELIDIYAGLVRYCYSCLVDADITDTIDAAGQGRPDTLKADFAQCLKLIDERLSSFKCTTDLQKARAVLQDQAFRNIDEDADLYLMSMPTGSGKTLASMKCALLRALKTNKEHIIYVIPYNSIIDQTAKEFETLFGQSAQILRHQSTFSYEDQDDLDEDYRSAAKYACENWDAPIIITTAVQFFESVDSAHKRKLRKFHNMANSVIVFDEAHLMPIQYLQPCLRAVAFITKYLDSEAIFATATMPDFESLIRQYALSCVKTVDLVPDHSQFFCFKKNEYVNMGTVSAAALLEKAGDYASSLIVVNTKKRARQLYQVCGGEKYHLSKYMTGKDLESTIATIKQRLLQLQTDYPVLKDVPDERKITVISTSLIEAGVDLDFAAAFREHNGLDSILQTGGRCNREGRNAIGSVYIFKLDTARKTQTVRQSILDGVLLNYADISSGQAITTYYNRLFNAERESITEHSLSRLSSHLDGVPFRTYSEKMKLIDSPAVSVVIPQSERIQGLIEKAAKTGVIDHRKIQSSCASVYPYEIEDLKKQGVLNEVCGLYVLNNPDYYDKETGLQFEGKDVYID